MSFRADPVWWGGDSIGIMEQEGSHRHQETDMGCGGRKKWDQRGNYGTGERPQWKAFSPDPKGNAVALMRKKRNMLCGNAGRQLDWVSVHCQEQVLLCGWSSVSCFPRRSLDVTTKSIHEFQPESQQVGQTHSLAGCFALFMLCCNYLSACIPHLSIY